MHDLRLRSQELEMMDNFDIPFEEYSQTYRQLQTVNTLTFTYYPTLTFIKRVCRQYHDLDCLRILDIGCGHGDMLRRIARLAGKSRLSVKLVGIDLNQKAIRSARLATSAKDQITFLAGDIFDITFDDDFDIIINSLVMHHLSADMIVKMIRWMAEKARVGWFINDLHRHAIPYYFIKYFVRFLGMNRMICHDAPLSVARGFSEKDWQEFIQRADVDASNVTVSWYCNFRFGVGYEHPHRL